MSEMENLIISIVTFVILLALLIFIIIFFKRKRDYVENTLLEIDRKNKLYYLNLKLKDDNLFPYFEKVKTGIRTNFESKGEFDSRTSIKLKPHYSFFEDRIIYIINNNLHYPKQIVSSDDQKYILIDDDIKTMEILITNERPSHYLLKYTFYRRKDREGFDFEVKEVDEYDGK